MARMPARKKELNQARAASYIGKGIVPPDGGGPILQTLTVSPSVATIGAAFAGSVSGKTAGSMLTLTGAGAAGLSVNGAAIAGTPTTAGAVNVVETLAGATGSPKTNSARVTASVAAPVLATLALTAAAFTAGAAAGTVIGSITGKTAGSTITVSDNRLAVSSDGSQLLVGVTASSAGTINATLTETLGGATGSPRDTAVAVTVSAAAAVAQMVIFAGQSQTNSNGTAGNTSDVPTALAGPMTDIFMWDPYGKTWVTYQAGVTSGMHLQGGLFQDPGKHYFGAEAEFARLWKVNNPGVPLYIIKEGFSTSCLDTRARSAGRGCWDPTLTGDLWTQFTTHIADAKANLTAAGKTPSIRSMNWTQGENDAGQIDASNAYQTNLGAFIDACRSAVLGSTAKFVISKITNGWTNSPIVRAAQAAVAASKINCLAVDGQDLPLAADNTHYSPTGIAILGKRIHFVTEPQPTASPAAILAAYYAAVGASPDTARGNALSALVTSLVTNGVWNDLANLQVYANYSQAAALVDLKTLVAAANSGMTWDANGFTGTGTTSSVDTGINPSTGDFRYVPESTMYAAYIRQLAAVSSGVDFGALGSGNTAQLVVGYTGTATSFRLNTAASDANNQIAGGYANIAGLWAMDRSALASASLYRDGALLKTDAVNQASGEPTANNIRVGNRGGGTNGTLRTYGAFVGGKSLTQAQHTALANAINTYMAAVGAV